MSGLDHLQEIVNQTNYNLGNKKELKLKDEETSTAVNNLSKIAGNNIKKTPFIDEYDFYQLQSLAASMNSEIDILSKDQIHVASYIKDMRNEMEDVKKTCSSAQGVVQKLKVLCANTVCLIRGISCVHTSQFYHGVLYPLA